MAPKSNQMLSMQNGTFSRSGEVIDWEYYDQATLAVATTVQRFFTIGLGSGATPKTLDVTNLTVGGMIPAGQRFVIKRLKLFYTTSAAIGTAAVQNIYSMLNQTTLEFLIPGKDSIFQCTLNNILGSSTNIALTPTAAGDNIPLNMPRFHGIYPLNTPIVLAAMTPFEVRVTHQTAVAAALAGHLLKISLCGELSRLS